MTDQHLLQQWQACSEKAGRPLFAVEAAQELGRSEAELQLCKANTTVLNSDLDSIISHMSELGHCMAMTRQPEMVIESRGIYERVETHDTATFIQGKNIHLQIVPDDWQIVLAVMEATPHGEKASIQFYTSTGEAIHKAILHEKDAQQRFDVFVKKHAANTPPHIVTQPDQQIATGNKTDSNQHSIDEFKQLMEAHIHNKCPLQLRSAKTSVIHNFCGTIQAIKEKQPWYNLFDRDLHCHINLEQLHRVQFNQNDMQLCNQFGSVFLEIQPQL